MPGHRTFVRHWDSLAPTYDRKMDGVERRLFPQSRAWVCSRARGRTLEVGIGTGANLSHYRGDVALTGLDWSAEMLDVARHRAVVAARQVTLQQGDAANLPFPDEAFDSVVSTFALCCIPNDRGAIAETLRVLRPGGRLILADHVASSSLPLRLVQRTADLVSVPLHGEHYTRRPLRILHEMGVAIEETERHKLGVIEHVRATR